MTIFKWTPNSCPPNGADSKPRYSVSQNPPYPRLARRIYVHPPLGRKQFGCTSVRKKMSATTRDVGSAAGSSRGCKSAVACRPVHNLGKPSAINPPLLRSVRAPLGRRDHAQDDVLPRRPPRPNGETYHHHRRLVRHRPRVRAHARIEGRARRDGVPRSVEGPSARIVHIRVVHRIRRARDGNKARHDNPRLDRRVRRQTRPPARRRARPKCRHHGDEAFNHPNKIRGVSDDGDADGNERRRPLLPHPCPHAAVAGFARRARRAGFVDRGDPHASCW